MRCRPHQPEIRISRLARLTGDAIVVDAGGELTKNGRRVRLKEQPFQLLSVLLQRPAKL